MSSDLDATALVGAVAQQILSLVEDTSAPPSLRQMILGHLRKPGKALAGEGSSCWGLLPLLASAACGGRWEPSVPVGAAVEFFIAAGDVLDDLADLDTAEATSSAGRPHLANAAAMLLMLTQRAILLLEERGAVASRVVSVSRAFAEAGLSAASGQHLDLEYERASSVTTEECLAMTALKSGSLASCACKVGALVATADPSLIAACAEFGTNLGVASQLLNDVHGLWAEELEKSDLPRRKKTLPVVYGLRWAEGLDRETLRQVYESTGELTAGQLSAVRDILWRLGALYFCSATVDIYRQRARTALQPLPPSQGKDILVARVRSTKEG